MYDNITDARTSSGLSEYLNRQREWSTRTFGPGKRTLGISDHIGKELAEIASDPTDRQEWIDVITLAMDGYWRCGGDPEELFADMLAKQRKNFARTWPASVSEDVAVEHDRTKDDGTSRTNDDFADAHY
jgi:hypothetical protein